MPERLGLDGTTAASSLEQVREDGAGQRVAGVVLIFSDGLPCMRPFRLEREELELGRHELRNGEHPDPQVSRKHLRFRRNDPGWQVTDLDSRNGTFVGGERIRAQSPTPVTSVVRVGSAVVLVVEDIAAFERFGVGVRGGRVAGPGLCAALESIRLIHQIGMVGSLMISGESGTGKELAARAFHAAAGKPDAPFSAVNCATIAKDIAERLLFGSRRGAYSGATDASGFVQAADGGTLFLDEVAELAADVQGKLLRMLETREVMRLGATAYEKVDLRVCAATWRDLRAEVAAGRFREDLYFRIGQPEVRLPPVRERREEIPWHIQQVLAECSQERPLVATASFVEACCLRRWPGNVRELRAEVRLAAARAVGRGTTTLLADDLSPKAGDLIAPASTDDDYPSDEVAAALQGAGGNVAKAARQLGIHRNKVRRWLERHSVDARALKGKGRES